MTPKKQPKNQTAKNALAKKVEAEIHAQGPLRLDRYIERCLWDEAHGYYRRAQVFGAAGDFITSPDISQIFGEMIGIWAVSSWQNMGEPSSFALLEMGGGRGALMQDVLKIARQYPKFEAAMTLLAFEKSASRREEQITTSKGALRFIERFDDLPDLPLIAFSNEFFDALPIRQFREDGGGWLEAFVSAALSKIWQPCPNPPAQLASFLDAHGIVELNEGAIDIMEKLGDHARRFGGRILSIDYGEFDGVGDSFQALQNHKMVDPFESPGEADLTAHIRFRDLANAAQMDCDFMTQAEFLEAMGGAQRLEKLKEERPALAVELAAGYHRLVDADAMGSLFKVLIQRT